MSEDSLQSLRARLAQVDDLERAAAVLEWDHQTYMPPAADHARAAQLATLHRLAHEIFVAEETGRLLADLQSSAADLPADSAVIPDARRRLLTDGQQCVPTTWRSFDRRFAGLDAHRRRVS